MEMRRERIESKQQQLRELILQQVSFKSLVTRNKEAEERGLVPSQNSAIQLPFITVNTHKKTQINCSISDDKYVHIDISYVYLSWIKNSDFFQVWVFLLFWWQIWNTRRYWDFEANGTSFG